MTSLQLEMSNPVSLLPFWKSGSCHITALFCQSFNNLCACNQSFYADFTGGKCGYFLSFFFSSMKINFFSDFGDSSTSSKAHYSNLLCKLFVATQHQCHHLFTLGTSTHDISLITTEDILAYPSQTNIASTFTYNKSLCSNELQH